MLVEAQQQILLAWLGLGVLGLGLGLVARAPIERAADLWGAFWVGVATLLTLLQLWHLVLPIDDRARIAIAALGALGLVVRGVRPWRLLLAALPRNAPVVVATLATAWWLSNRCLAGPSLGDTAAYFIPTINWLEAFPIVPGLANLFVPLGHNFSYFLYVALLDAGPFLHRPWHIVNGFLLLALFARAALAAVRLVRGSEQPKQPNQPMAAELYWLATLPALVELACGLLLTSPTPDFAVHIVGFVLGGELIAFVTSDRPARSRCLALVFVAAAGATVKASALVLGAATVAVAVVWWLARIRPRATTAFSTLALAALLATVPVGTWMVRNVITSGCPLYPSQLGAVPVEWRAGADAVAWIQRPMEFPLITLVKDPHWAYNRLFSLGWWDPEFQPPAVLLAVAAVVAVIVRAGRRLRGRRGNPTVLVLVPPLLSLAFVFANTPMPKYQGAILWMLPIELLVVGLAGALAGAGLVARAALVALAVAGTAVPASRPESLLLDLRDYQPVGRHPVTTRRLASGLELYVPVENDSCGEGPLPCTPEPNPALRLRRDGDLAAGFMIGSAAAE